MVSSLLKSIADGLKRVCECTIYPEDVPQNFKRPSFMVFLHDQEPSRGLNGRKKNTVSMDISYFPEDESREECLLMGEKLAREFSLRDFKIKNRNLKTVDHVLHFMFEVSYREYCADDTELMQGMSYEEKLEEE